MRARRTRRTVRRVVLRTLAPTFGYNEISLKAVNFFTNRIRSIGAVLVPPLKGFGDLALRVNCDQD